MTPERAASLAHDQDLSERVDDFVARFGPLQDTVADKLLPALLAWLAEPISPAIDNLDVPSAWAGLNRPTTGWWRADCATA